MFLPIKVITDRRPRKDGSSPIYIQYCHSSDKRTLLPTGIFIPPGCWNRGLLRIMQDLPAEFGQADLLNLQLREMVRSLENLVTFAQEQKMGDPIGFLKKAWSPELDPASLASRAKEIAQAPVGQPDVSLDFFYQLDDYIKTKRRKVSTGMVRTYNVVKERLLAFQRCRKEKITFDSFDFNFYDNLVRFTACFQRILYL